MDLEEKLRSIRNNRGVNLYDHLMNVLGKILLEKEGDPYANFERISAGLKDRDVYLGSTDAVGTLIRENGADLDAEIKKLRAFLKIEPKPEPVDKEEEAPPKEDEPPTNVLSNIIVQERITRKCGVSIGEEDAFLLATALKQFSGSKNAVKCTFWGKVTGHNVDYWVVECPPGEKQEGDEAIVTDEPVGQGVNSKSYWVTTDLLAGGWVELPPVSAKQIRQARTLQYVFTGNLTRKIIASPEFDGEERHYVS